MALGYKPLTRGRKPHPPPPPVTTLDISFDAGMDARLVPMWSATDPGDRLDTDQRSSLTVAQSSVATGILTMTCHRQVTPSGRAFAGAAWSTYGKFGQRFGTFETRLRYDEAQGTWPSWFFLPVGQKAPFPEIDAMESYGSPACLGPGATEHVTYGAGGPPSVYAVVPLANSSGWHVFKFVWTSASIKFYIDGVSTFTVTDVSKIPQVAMYPIFTWGLGANNPSCRVDNTTPDTLTMQVDYLKAWPLA